MKDMLGNEIHVGDMVAWSCSEDHDEYHLEVSEVVELYADEKADILFQAVRVRWGVHEVWEAGLPDDVVVVKTP